MNCYPGMMQEKLWEKTFLLTIFVITFSDGQNIKQCPDYQIHFEKIIGFRPPTVSSISANYGAPFEEKILYKSYHKVPSVINLQCMELCRNDHNCESYVLNFNKSECYGLTSNEKRLEIHNLRRSDDHELVEDISVIYFVKTCLSSEYHSCLFVRQNSHTNLWAFAFRVFTLIWSPSAIINCGGHSK